MSTHMFSWRNKKNINKFWLKKNNNTYCAFDIFQEVVLCLMLYKEELNLQTFVMI